MPPSSAPLPASLRIPEPTTERIWTGIDIARADAAMGDECPCDSCNPFITDQEATHGNDQTQA